MASNVTHFFFGRRLQEHFPQELLDIIEKHQDYFDIGQQGPDIFFFHIPFNKNKGKMATGDFIHDHTFQDFINRNRELLVNTPIDSPEWAYFLGAICHFILDISLHPTIDELELHLDIRHLEMERELDRQILQEENIDPKTFFSREIIPDPNKVTDVISKFYQSYEGVNHHIVKQSLYYMRLIETFFHVTSKREENIKTKLLRWSGKDKEFMGKILFEKPHKDASIVVPILKEGFDYASGVAYYALSLMIQNHQDLPSQDIFQFDFVGHIL